MSTVNATGVAAFASGLEKSEFLPGFLDVIVDARTELLLFAAAVLGYLALFSQKTPANPKSRAKNPKVPDEDDNEDRKYSDTYTNNKAVDKNECAELERALVVAFEC